MRSLTAVLLLACASQLHGQGAINAVPTQLTFNSANGTVAGGSQNLVIIASTGATATFTTSVSSGAANWLSVSPQSGTTPQTISVTANPGTLGQGSFAGFITVTSPNGSTTVPVTLNVNLNGTTAIVPSPATLSFNFPVGSTGSQTQQLSLSGAGGPSTFSITPSTSSGANWLTVSGTSGSPVGVTVNPASLGFGTFLGAITVNASGVPGIVIPVQVSISYPGAINITPQQLTFGYQTATAAPPSQTLILTTTGGGPIPFSVLTDTSACIGNWFTVTPSSGFAPTTLSVQVNPTGLPNELCFGSIYITAPSAVNSSITIPISLLVSDSPVLQAPSGATIYYQVGNAAPPTQTIQIGSSSTPVNYSIAASPSFGSPNFLTISPSTVGTTPQSISLGVDPTVLAGLAPNTYAENVTINSQGSANPQVTFTVVLVVSTNPFLTSSQSSATFNYQIGQAAPPSQTIALSSTGAALAFNVFPTTTSCSGFLTASPAVGTTSLQAGQQSQLTIGVNTAGLTTPQTCSGTVLVLTPGSTSAAVSIPVTLNVTSVPTGAARGQ